MKTRAAYSRHKTKLAAELKKRIISAGGPGVLVRGGQGTAYGWIEVTGGPTLGSAFTKQQITAIKRVFPGQSPGANFFCIPVHQLAKVFNMPMPSSNPCKSNPGIGVRNPVIGDKPGFPDSQPRNVLSFVCAGVITTVSKEPETLGHVVRHGGRMFKLPHHDWVIKGFVKNPWLSKIGVTIGKAVQDPKSIIGTIPWDSQRGQWYSGMSKGKVSRITGVY